MLLRLAIWTGLVTGVAELIPGERRRCLVARCRVSGCKDIPSGTLISGVAAEPRLPSWYPAARGNLRSVAFDGWRYIWNEGDGIEELYDFEHDLLERWNLVGTVDGNRLLPRYRAAARQPIQ